MHWLHPLSALPKEMAAQGWVAKIPQLRQFVHIRPELQ